MAAVDKWTVPAWLRLLWENMNMLPGPLWILGAWIVFRVFRWIVTLPDWIVFIAMAQPEWEVVGRYALSCIGLLLPLGVLWSLVYRKSYAMSLLCWYVLLRLTYFVVKIFLPISTKPGPLFRYMSKEWLVDVGWYALAMCLWFGLLVYLERADVFTKLFPQAERRKTPWWIVVPMAIVVVLSGG